MNIDRLTLEVPGLSPHDAQRLAALVGDALTGYSGAPRAIARVDATVRSHEGEPVERLAARIAEAIVKGIAA